MRKTGRTYKAIGAEFGVSAERVRQIVSLVTKRPVAPPVEKQSLATRDVARLLSVHPNTVRRWANDGTLKAYRVGSRRDRRFRREDIEKILDAAS